MTDTTPPTKNVLYFGCWSKSDIGHYLYTPDRRSALSAREWTPKGLTADKLDGLLCPRTEQGGEQRLGHALLHHLNGWTVVAFWDRSADGRPASNAAFLAEGTHTFERMLDLAAERFPVQWARITSAFELVQVDALVIEPDGSARIAGAPAAVHARLLQAGRSWTVTRIDLGYRLMADIQERELRRNADAGQVRAFLGIPTDRDMRLEPDWLRARLSPRPDSSAISDAVATIGALLNGSIG